MSCVFEPWSQFESSLKLNAFEYRSACENKPTLSHWNIHSQWFSDMGKEVEGKWRGFSTERLMQLLEEGIMNSFGSKNKTDSSCLDHSVEQWFLSEDSCIFCTTWSLSGDFHYYVCSEIIEQTYWEEWGFAEEQHVHCQQVFYQRL